MKNFKRFLMVAALFIVSGCAASLDPTATLAPRPTTTPSVLLPPTEIAISATEIIEGLGVDATIPVAEVIPPSPIPSIVPPTAAAPVENFPWTDERAVMSGICFAAANDAAGQVFVLRNAVDHIRFYDLADNSELCRRPVVRNPFDFEEGERVLAGLWTRGQGCTARHDVLGWSQDGTTLRIQLLFSTGGECDYALVQPYFIGIRGVDEVLISVE